MKDGKQMVTATVKVRGISDMTTARRKRVCDWLRKLADDIQREPEAFARTFVARYMNPAATRHGTIKGDAR